MQIRRAELADLAAIEAIVAAAYGKYVERMGQKPGPMLDDYRARIASGDVWVADAGEVAGLLVLVLEADALQVDNVAVSPSQQRQGVGRALLSFAEAEARRRSVARLTLYTNAAMTENVTLYTALGWREIGRGEQDGYARVFFEKPVGSASSQPR